MSASPTAQMIPRRPLLWLAAALLFLVPAMLASIVAWVPLVFLAALLAKFWLHRKDRRLRSRLVQLLLALVAFGAVVASYGSARGIEPGVSLLVLIASLKVLEAHTARDFHVLIMIGWVLCLGVFLMSQELQIALCVLAAFVLLIAALIQFHRRTAAGRGVWFPLVSSVKLLLQALPLIVALFFVFPRGTGGLRLQVIGATGDMTGFSGELSPGSVASVAGSEDNAFRVEFPEGNMPPRPSLYWRGAVLWDGDGLNWAAGDGLGRARPLARSGALVRQIITLEPHAGRWLFALDRPVEAPAGVNLAPGRYLRSVRPIASMRRYEVVSALSAVDEELHERERNRSLRPPSYVSAEMLDLVKSWKAQDADPLSTVRSALEFFRTQGFVYSLSPGQYLGADALDDLLFQRKRGFCEHYAGAFATLMRLAGIPSRVVVGYLGGQFNQYGNYLLVRQSDAHAWCEVWLPNEGWTRVDPTSVMAPERLEIGSLRDMRTTSTQGKQANAGRTLANNTLRTAGLANELRLAWDTVSYTWDSRVLSFDVDGQREFFTDLGMATTPGLPHLIWSAVVAAIVLGSYIAFLAWRSRRRTDHAQALYETFCTKAARLGAARLAVEGPADFAKRASLQLPQHASDIERIAKVYIQIRYAPRPARQLMEVLATHVRAFPRRRVRE